jgi:hypothetical protein
MLKRNFIFILVFSFFFLVSCSDSEPDSSDGELSDVSKQSNEVIVEVEEAKEIQAPQWTEALLVFSFGDVEKKVGNSWEFIDIGEILGNKDIVRTGLDSEAEIQFGDLALVSVQENSEVALSGISLRRAERRSTVQLNSGSILSKVDTLTSDDNFRIRTSNAVLGVRGTVFKVSADSETGDTQVAVSEGSVAVLPAPEEADVLFENDEKSEASDAILDSLEEEASVLEAGSSVEVTETDASEFKEEFEEIGQQVLEAPNNEEITEESRSVLVQNTQQERQDIGLGADRTLERRRSLEETQREELNNHSQRELVDLNQPGGQEDQFELRAAPIIVVVDQARAQIFINGRPRGRGEVAFISSIDEVTRLRISLAGFETIVQEVRLENLNGQVLRFRLRPAEGQTPVDNSEESSSRPGQLGPNRNNPNAPSGDSDTNSPNQDSSPQTPAQRQNPGSNRDGRTLGPRGQNPQSPQTPQNPLDPNNPEQNPIAPNSPRNNPRTAPGRNNPPTNAGDDESEESNLLDRRNARDLVDEVKSDDEDDFFGDDSDDDFFNDEAKEDGEF